MTIGVGQLLVWIMVGAIAGFLAGQIFRGRGYGFIGNVLIGLVGALIGGILVQAFKIKIPDIETFEFTIGDVLVAFVGALILLIVLRLIGQRRR